MTEKETPKTCGYCSNFVQLLSELEGICKAIPSEKPGARGKKVRFDMDGSECPKFDALTEVRRYDVSQQAGWGAGGFYQMRSADVFATKDEERRVDRLVYQKHAEEEPEEEKKKES